MRVRENAESIAFYGGNEDERVLLKEVRVLQGEGAERMSCGVAACHSVRAWRCNLCSRRIRNSRSQGHPWTCARISYKVKGRGDVQSTTACARTSNYVFPFTCFTSQPSH